MAAGRRISLPVEEIQEIVRSYWEDIYDVEKRTIHHPSHPC